jgi:hypothetical protein
MFEMARPLAGIPEEESEKISAALGDMILALLTEETPSTLTVRVASGIPNLAALLPMLGLWGGMPSGGMQPSGVQPGGPPAVSRAPESAVAVRTVGVVSTPSTRGFDVRGDATIAPATAPDAIPPLPLVPPWDPGRTMVLVPKGSTWRYSDSGGDLATAWREPRYDDGSWKSGPAPLGYGEDALGTTVQSGDAESKHPTTYFRRTFRVERPEDLAEVRILLRRDDGAAIYLNGKEVARDNLAPGSDAKAFSVEIVGGDWEAAFVPHPVKPEDLRAGDNTLAIEVHQCNGSSSDVIFDLAVEGLAKGPEGSF